MKCPKCGSENPGEQKFCGNCGTRLDGPATRICVSCGRTIQFEAMVCQYCGYDYRMKFRGGQQGAAISRFLSYGLTLTGLWVLAIGVANWFGYGFYHQFGTLIDVGFGIVLLVLGLRSLTPREGAS